MLDRQTKSYQMSTQKLQYLFAKESSLLCLSNVVCFINPDMTNTRLLHLSILSYFTDTKLTILQSLLFVKQIQSMHDFFVLCQSNARSFVIDRSAASGNSVAMLRFRHFDRL